jgi:hypothetical protein
MKESQKLKTYAICELGQIGPSKVKEAILNILFSPLQIYLQGIPVCLHPLQIHLQGITLYLHPLQVC